MESEEEKKKKKNYTVHKLLELPSISLRDLSEIRHFEHTPSEYRDRRKVLLLALRNHLEELKERKEIINHNYDQIKQYEDDLKVRKQRDARELNKLQQIVKELREAMTVTVESTSKYTFRVVTTTRGLPHEKDKQFSRSKQSDKHKETNPESTSDDEDSYDDDEERKRSEEEEDSEERRDEKRKRKERNEEDKKSGSKSKSKNNSKSKSKKKSLSKTSDRQSSKRLRTKRSTPRSSDPFIIDLSLSRLIHGGAAITSATSATSSTISESETQMQGQTLAEQYGFSTEQIQSKTVKLFPQTTISSVTNDSLNQLWNRTHEYFNPLPKELVDIEDHPIDSVSSVSNHSTESVEIVQQEEKSVSWIDRLLGCLIIDSPQATKDVLEKIRKQNQENESKTHHQSPKREISEISSTLIDGDTAIDSQDEQEKEKMLNRAIEEELRDIGLVMEERLPEDEWTNENYSLEDEDDEDVLAMQIQELNSIQQDIRKQLDKIKPLFLEEVERMGKRRKRI